MKRLLCLGFTAFLMALPGCLPWDYRYETRYDYPKYPDKTPFDRFKEKRLAQENPVIVAGASKADITPPKKTGVLMAGYNSNRRSTGVESKLYARCAVIDDGKNTVALVATDLIGLFHDDIVKAQKRVSSRWGEYVLIGAVHNHEGPDTMGLWGKSPFGTIPVKSGIDPDYMNFLFNRIATCVFDAVESAKPASFKAARIDVPHEISVNLHESEFKENTMTLLEAVGAGGASIFTISNWPMHVEALDEENHLLSPDWAGEFCRNFEKNHDGTMIYFNGALGGMVTVRQDKYAPLYEKERYMRVIGRVVADAAREGLDRNSAKIEVKEIVFRKAQVMIPFDNSDLNLAVKLGLLKRYLKDKATRSEVDLIEMGPVRIVTAPGELLPAVGFKVKEILGSRYPFILGLTQDELGYILPAEYFKNKSYEYEQSVSAGPKTEGIYIDTVKSLLAGGGKGI